MGITPTPAHVFVVPTPPPGRRARKMAARRPHC
jgi:hypothetical protein